MALVGLPGFVFLATYTLENLLSPRSVEKFETGFQFLTGNWPSSQGTLGHDTVIFASFVAFRFTLIYGSIAAVLGTLRSLRAWRRMAVMNYLEMIRDRDDAIENELRGLINKNVPEQQREQFEREIQKAIEQGDRFWRETYLASIVGDAALAARILSKLEREQVTP